MGSEIKQGAGKSIFDANIAVGERVTLDDPETEYVVVKVDHAIGRVELLRLKPGRIERDIPLSTVRKKVETGPRLVSEDKQ